MQGRLLTRLQPACCLLHVFLLGLSTLQVGKSPDQLCVSFLTSCVAYVCSALKRSGECLFNGQPLTKKLKRQIGYVMQVKSLPVPAWSLYGHSSCMVPIGIAAAGEACHMQCVQAAYVLNRTKS